jgi:hypothetical protein
MLQDAGLGFFPSTLDHASRVSASRFRTQPDAGLSRLPPTLDDLDGIVASDIRAFADHGLRARASSLDHIHDMLKRLGGVDVRRILRNPIQYVFENDIDKVRSRVQGKTPPQKVPLWRYSTRWNEWQ